MHIFFFDPTGRGYDPQTPLRQSLGGTEAAVAYLSAALARQGVKVSLLNNSQQEKLVDGVRLLTNGTNAGNAMRDADMVVIVASAVGRRLRAQMAPDLPLVLWCHMAADQPNVAALATREEQDAWSAFVMVSQWQIENYVGTFGVPREKALPIGNAASPAFTSVATRPAWFETGEAPTLVHTGTPLHGLEVLLLSYPSIRARIPDVRLKVFSALKLPGDQGMESFRHLHELARVLPGSEYGGVISPPQLPGEIAGAAALAYPSTFAETSCIAAMEAMSLGAEPITSDLGALPETLAGFGRITPFGRGQIDLLHGFVDTVVDALNEARQNPGAAAERRARRIAFAKQNYVWDNRATQWIALAEKFMRARRGGVPPRLNG